MFIGRAGAWAGQDWNTGVDMPTGWIYWLPPVGGNDGVLDAGFENTRITKEASHSGSYSLKFDLPVGRRSQDGFVGTKRYLLNEPSVSGKDANNGDITNMMVNPGDIIRVSVWAKGANLIPDSAAAAPVTWAVGYTYGFFKGNGHNDGFNNVDGYPKDMQFVLPNATSFDWKQFSLDIPVPNTPDAKALEVRLHVYSRFVGTIYFDDLTVEKIAATSVNGKQIPRTYDLSQNYPNPFNPTTTINYSLPKSGNISLIVYDVLGRKVRTILNGFQNAGNFQAVWDGKDESGRIVSTGIYFYSLRANDFSLVKKMMMLK